MFELIQRQMLPHQDIYGTATRINEALFRQSSIALAQIGPTSWMGKGAESGYGTAPKVTLIAVPMGGGYALDLKIEAELEDKGIIFLGVSWAVCLPVAAVLFFLAWRDFSNRRDQLFAAAWSVLQLGAGPPVAGNFPPAWG